LRCQSEPCGGGRRSPRLRLESDNPRAITEGDSPEAEAQRAAKAEAGAAFVEAKRVAPVVVGDVTLIRLGVVGGPVQAVVGPRADPTAHTPRTASSTRAPWTTPEATVAAAVLSMLRHMTGSSG